MDTLNQPHDKYFRATFGEVGFASNLLTSYLPKDLLNLVDISTLEPQKESYLDKKLQEQFTDLLFRVNINNKEGYIYFLFEHKSYQDRMVIFQLLKYMIAIWESKLKGNESLPVIIPMVIYHDNGEWKPKQTLGEMILDYDLLPENLKIYIPNFEYILYDLSKWTKEGIKLEAEYKIAVKALTKARYASKDEILSIIVEAVELLMEIEQKDTVTYYISECIKYVLSIRDDISEVEIKNVVEKISIEGGELVMSVAERLIEQGLEQGLKQGLELGARKEKIKAAKTGIIKGYSMEIIMDMTGLTEEEIEEVRQEMLRS